MKTGVLLINLGTPDAPTTPAVRRYLREFLTDPYVIDIPWVLRSLLVYGIILPFRPKRSAAQYQQIWTDEGSPLLLNHLAMCTDVSNRLGDAFAVEPAMRYGSPSIEHAVRKLKERNVDSIVALPLYPQYSLAASESSIAKTKEIVGKILPNVPLKIAPPFYAHPKFIQSFCQVARPYVDKRDWDHILFSFHGLPIKQIKKTDPSRSHCFQSPQCCDAIVEHNRLCYRAHSVESAKRMATELGLKPDEYTVCFQSRLTNSGWLMPFTDHLLESLPKEGKKRILVIVPSFVADCLETLEEIAIRGNETLVGSGGESVMLVPSLNAEPSWCDTVATLVREAGERA